MVPWILRSLMFNESFCYIENINFHQSLWKVYCTHTKHSVIRAQWKNLLYLQTVCFTNEILSSLTSVSSGPTEEATAWLRTLWRKLKRGRVSFASSLQANMGNIYFWYCLWDPHLITHELLLWHVPNLCMIGFWFELHKSFYPKGPIDSESTMTQVYSATYLDACR